MRTSNYMVAVSAAAILLAGSAFAQSPGMDKGSAGGAMQKSEPAAPPAGGAMKGPAEKAAPAAKGAEGAKGSEGMRAQDAPKGADSNRMTQDNKAAPGGKNAAEKNATDKNAADNAKSNDKKGSTNTATDTKSGAAPANRTATDSKAGADSKNAETTTKSSTTTGSTKDSVSLTTEQKTTLREKVLVGGAPRVDHVDFAINVGTRVPSSVRVVEVPAPIIEIHPQWRGYRYFVVNDQIIIVEPRTLEIVAVLAV